MIPFPELETIVEPVAPGAAGGTSAALWWWLLAGVMVAVVLMLGWMWLRAVSRRLAVPGLPPEAAREALRRLEELGARQNADGLVVAGEVSEIIRHYLDRSTGVMARYATTPELMGRVRRRVPPPLPAVAVFEGVLAACDRVKYGAGAEERAALIASAVAAVEASRAAPLPEPVTPGILNTTQAAVPPIPNAPVA